MRGWIQHTIKNLTKNGTTSSSRVGIVANNCPQIIILEMACGLMGVTCTPMNASASVGKLFQSAEIFPVGNGILTKRVYRTERIKNTFT